MQCVQEHNYYCINQVICLTIYVSIYLSICTRHFSSQFPKPQISPLKECDFVDPTSICNKKCVFPSAELLSQKIHEIWVSYTKGMAAMMMSSAVIHSLLYSQVTNPPSVTQFSKCEHSEQV